MLCFYVLCFFVFFFKQKTAYEMRISDWSSDVCSSDLGSGACRDDRLDDDGKIGDGLIEGSEHGLHPGGIGLAERPGRLRVDIGVAGEDAPHPCFDGCRWRQVGHGRLESPGRFADGRKKIAVDVLRRGRSEEHTSELQSLMSISYVVILRQKNST